MRRHYFFHDESDFFKWYKSYLSSKELIRVYKYYYSKERKKGEYDKFKEAEEIVAEYKTFICSLSDNDKEYLEESIKNGYFNYQVKNLHPEILENWKIIVIDSKKHNLFKVDVKQLGIAFKIRRQECGLYRNEVARYAGINPRRLRCYEDGEREISIISFYKLIQLYEIGDISDFLMKYSLIKNEK